MRRLISTCIFLAISLSVSGQKQMKAFVLSNTKTINSIKPDDTDYSDLEYLGTALKDSRIVMLGEQDHGDAATFLAKTRIIKYLHQRLGFGVLVFESDFWGMKSAWQQNAAMKFSIDSIRSNTYKVWADCKLNDALFSYIDQKFKCGSPLIVAGMDCRHSLGYSQANYLQQWNDSVMAKVNINDQLRSDKKLNLMIRNLLQKEFTYKPSPHDTIFFFKTIKEIERQLPDGSFWHQDCRNLQSWARHSWNLKYNNPSRDIQMADNLKWIFDHQYNGKKIIVWAHNSHLAKNITKEVKDKQRAPYSSTVGQLTSQQYKDSVYILGFTSFHGTAGAIGYESYKVSNPAGICIENWIHDKNIDFGFINFKDATLHERFRMKGLNHELVLADWTRVFDGVFYIKEMFNCTAKN